MMSTSRSRSFRTNSFATQESEEEAFSPTSVTSAKVGGSCSNDAYDKVPVAENLIDQPSHGNCVGTSPYGYEVAAPDIASRNHSSTDQLRRMSSIPPPPISTPNSTRSYNKCIGRRSSMKSSNQDEYSVQRRQSIKNGGFVGKQIKVRLPGYRERVIRRSTISFNEEVRVMNVEPVLEITHDAHRLWFQPEEYEKIRRKNEEIVEKISRDQVLGTEESGTKVHKKRYCIRGLEGLLDKKNQIMRDRMNAWDTVLDEQAIQRNSYTFDEESMAEIYRSQTLQSQQLATLRAQRDATDIAAYRVQKCAQKKRHRGRRGSV